MDPERARLYPFLPSLGAGLPVARTEGSFLVLPDGRRILDAAGGAVVASIGHGRSEVAEVAARTLAEVSFVVPPFATEQRVRLVERLRASWLPPGITRCVFASGGSEAIDLAVRVARQNLTGTAVAEWCAGQAEFSAVHHPSLPTHPRRVMVRMRRLLSGYGGMLGVELKGGPAAADRFLRSLTIAIHAPSLGGVDTLVSEPRFTSHAGLTPEQRAEAGIPDGFLRFSLGLEDADDLIADFARALAQL